MSTPDKEPLKLTVKKKWKWATRDGTHDEVYFWTHKPVLGADGCWWNEQANCAYCRTELFSHNLQPGECRRIAK